MPSFFLGLMPEATTLFNQLRPRHRRSVTTTHDDTGQTTSDKKINEWSIITFRDPVHNSECSLKKLKRNEVDQTLRHSLLNPEISYNQNGRPLPVRHRQIQNSNRQTQSTIPLPLHGMPETISFRLWNERDIHV
jgi:hypothetical protein